MRLFAIALALLSLSSASAMAETSDVLARLEAAEQRWTVAALNTYEYTFTYRAFWSFDGCENDTFRTQVVNGVALSGCEALRQPFGTVPQLFAFIRNALAKKPDSLEVSFDPENGCPVSFRVDYKARVSDDGVYFEVTGFTHNGN